MVFFRKLEALAQSETAESARTFKAVRKFQLVLGGGGIAPVVGVILYRLTANLRELRIAAWNRSCPRHHPNLKVLVLGRTFALLTDVRVGELTMSHAHFIPLLCISAPALTSLDISFPGYFIPTSSPEPPQNLTQLVRLRCSFTWWEPPLSHGESEVLVPPTVTALLHNSPLLQQLSMYFRIMTPTKERKG
jgi:hypothetical protein